MNGQLFYSTAALVLVLVYAGYLFIKSMRATNRSNPKKSPTTATVEYFPKSGRYYPKINGHYLFDDAITGCWSLHTMPGCCKYTHNKEEAIQIAKNAAITLKIDAPSEIIDVNI